MKKIILIFAFSLSIFSLCVGQNGFRLEYKGMDKGTDQQTHLLKTYSLNGNSLNERTNLKYPSEPNTSIYLKNSPDTSFLIYSNKTYLKLPDKQLSEYKVKILGTDQVNGYACTKFSLDTRGQNDQIVWVSTQVPFYENYLTAMVNDIDLTKLTEALKKKNIKGFPIKIMYIEEKSIQYEFIKSQVMDIPSAQFELQGYSEVIMETSDDLHKQNKISNEEFEAMKLAEMEAQKIAEEQAKSKKEKKRKK